MTTPITPAHDQKLSVHLVIHYPAHEPRADDPHYVVFNQVRRRLEKAGALKCWRCGATENIEIHHTLEFSLANAIDVARFVALNPQLGVTDEESFLNWMEGEGNFLALCMECHRGPAGIHFCPYPIWVAQRYTTAKIVEALPEKTGPRWSR